MLSWNIMARAGNIVSVCLGHMAWQNDALCIYFAHMKNDQTANRSRDPHHIYANSIKPEICPILELAIYLIVYHFRLLKLHCFMEMVSKTDYDTRRIQLQYSRKEIFNFT
eukprot:NODE_584_length_5696_cov_0.763623.p4 type:complete len:110 gc:universal NODE_584_length_5696_cov_0.763623:5326-5655(+)